MVTRDEEGMARAGKLNIAALLVERSGTGFIERTTPRVEEIASTRYWSER
jgi:hypothetical protein